jgi:hypothetical protein
MSVLLQENTQFKSHLVLIGLLLAKDRTVTKGVLRTYGRTGVKYSLNSKNAPAEFTAATL